MDRVEGSCNGTFDWESRVWKSIWNQEGRERHVEETTLEELGCFLEGHTRTSIWNKFPDLIPCPWPPVRVFLLAGKLWAQAAVRIIHSDQTPKSENRQEGGRKWIEGQKEISAHMLMLYKSRIHLFSLWYSLMVTSVYKSE